MTVEELLQKLDYKELIEWMAFYEISPFGDERSDFQAGVIASTVANVNKRKNRKPYRPQDFMFKPSKKKQTVDEQWQIILDMHKKITGNSTKGE